MIRFKYQGDFVAGRALAYLLAQNLAHEYANRVWPETLIPVPLHWCRRLYRGFNQAQWLAKAVLRELNTQFSPSELPVLNTHLCRRTRYTPSQQGLSKDQRENNLNKAFIIKSKSLEGHSFALIDDVVTTGSTAAAISHELMRVGAGEIALWAPTRVLPKQ